MNHCDNSLDDDRRHRMLEKLATVMLNVKTLQENGSSPDDDETGYWWEKMHAIVIACPEVVAATYDEGSPFHLQLIHFCFEQCPPPHVFDAIVTAYPHALDIPFTCSIIQTRLPQTPRLLIFSYLGLWHTMGDPQEFNFSLNRVHMAQHLIKHFPDSFSLLEDEFRSYVGADVPEGGALCSYIFANSAARIFLLETLEEVFGTDKLKEWLPCAKLEMINRREPFPVDAVAYLSKLHQPDFLKLIVSTERDYSGNAEVAVKYEGEAQDYGGDKTMTKCLTVTFSAHPERTDIFHLNSVLELMVGASSALPPLRAITCNGEEGDFFDYHYSLYSGADVGNLKGMEYFTVDPDLARVLTELESFDSVLDVTGPQQLLDFVKGLERFPNLKPEASTLVLKISTTGMRDEDSDVWLAAFLGLASTPLSALRLGFNFSTTTQIPETAIQCFLEQTQSLVALEVYGYCLRLEPFARGLKGNTSVEEFIIHGLSNREYRYDDSDVIMNALEQNFAVTSVEIGGEDRAYCNRYSVMNEAGRKRLFQPEATIDDAIHVLGNAIEKEHSWTGNTQTDTLYGLLRSRPDLWAS